MRILRVTGVHGLCGMEYKRADGIIRPLLGTTRAEIEEYCKEKALKPRIDNSAYGSVSSSPYCLT